MKIVLKTKKKIKTSGSEQEKMFETWHTEKIKQINY